MTTIETLKKDYEIALAKLAESADMSYSTYRRHMRVARELFEAIQRMEAKYD